MTRKTWLKILKNLAFLIIGLSLLYLAFRGQDINKLMDDLKGANYFYVGLSVLFGFAAYWSRAARWLILLEPMGYTPKLSSSVYSIIVGYFANLAIPRIGEITRCTVMNQAEDIPVVKLFGTVILERLIDLFMLLSLTLIVVLLKVDQFGGFFLGLIESNKDVFPFIINLFVVLTIGGIIGIAALYLMRSRLRNISIAIKIRSFLHEIKEGLISIRKIRNRKGFYFHTLFIWFCYFVMTWVVFYSLEETAHLGLINGLFILVVGGFGMAAPVQGGIGAYHFIVSRGMGVIGISSIPALSYATIVHTSQTVSVLVVGSISLGMLYLNKKKRATQTSTV